MTAIIPIPCDIRKNCGEKQNRARAGGEEGVPDMVAILARKNKAFQLCGEQSGHSQVFIHGIILRGQVRGESNLSSHLVF